MKIYNILHEKNLGIPVLCFILRMKKSRAGKIQNHD